MEKPSLFGLYIKERLNKNIIEDDNGFCTYIFLQDGVYLEDIYVHPDHRQSGKASELADRIAEIAKEKGLKKMYGSVVPNAKFSTESLKVLLAYGFRLKSSEQNVIYFEKDL